MSWNLTKYNPRRAAEISRLSRVMQRDWRRRGFIDEPDHDAFEVAYMRLAKMLSDAGIGPALSQPWKRLVASCVVSHALRSHDAYDGGVKDLPDDCSELRKAILREAMTAWRGKLPAGAEGSIHRAPRFAMWTNDGMGGMGDSLDGLYQERSDDRREAFPAVIFDIHVGGVDLLREAGFLVNVKLEARSRREITA